MTTRKAVLKLSHKWLGFTQRQDLKLTAGVDVDWPLGAREPVAVGDGYARWLSMLLSDYPGVRIGDVVHGSLARLTRRSLRQALTMFYMIMHHPSCIRS